MTLVHLQAGIFTLFAYLQSCLLSELLFSEVFVYIWHYIHNAYAAGRAVIHIKCGMYFISLFSLILEVVFIPFLFKMFLIKELHCGLGCSPVLGNFIIQILITLCYSTGIIFPRSQST